MGTVTIGALAGHFGRDVDRGVSKAVGIIEAAARDGVDLLVFPDAALGGYIGDLRSPDLDDLPPALDPDGPELAAIAEAARDMTVCIGYTERDGDVHYNAAACLTGDGVLGWHRKVHQPAGESKAYAAGDRFSTFSTPVGRIGMLIDYDKTFPSRPESSRSTAPGSSRLSRRGRPASPTAQLGCPLTGSLGCSISTTALAPRRTRYSWCPPTSPG